LEIARPPSRGGKLDDVVCVFRIGEIRHQAAGIDIYKAFCHFSGLFYKVALANMHRYQQRSKIHCFRVTQRDVSGYICNYIGGIHRGWKDSESPFGILWVCREDFAG